MFSVSLRRRALDCIVISISISGRLVVIKVFIKGMIRNLRAKYYPGYYFITRLRSGQSSLCWLIDELVLEWDPSSCAEMMYGNTRRSAHVKWSHTHTHTHTHKHIEYDTTHPIRSLVTLLPEVSAAVPPDYVAALFPRLFDSSIHHQHSSL